MASKRLPILLAVWLALLPAPCSALAGDAPEEPDAVEVHGVAKPAGAEAASSGDNAAITEEPTGPSDFPSSETAVPSPPAPPPAGDNAAVPLLPAVPAAADNAAGIDNIWVDRYHSGVEEGLFLTVAWFDRFFGSEREEVTGRPESTLRWKNDFRYDGLQHFTYRSAWRARIWLPHLAKSWHLVIAGENQGDPTAAIPVDPGNPGTNVQSQIRAVSTELVYDLFRTKQTFFSLGAGVQVKIPPDVFGRVRLGYVQPLGSDTLARFTATAYWNAREGPGQSNELAFERRLSPAALLRWSNSITISEGSNGWNWGTELALGYMLSPSSGLSFGGSARGPTRPGVEVQNYRVYTGYRRSVLRRWLFLELEPDINWPLRENEGRRPVYGATFRVEVFFLGKEAAYLTR